MRAYVINVLFESKLSYTAGNMSSKVVKSVIQYIVVNNIKISDDIGYYNSTELQLLISVLIYM